VKKETGVSAKQYIINRLMTEARRLLQLSELPVSEIAWKLGFGDSSYFIRLFRNETGISPLAFRKRQ
jgi:AraC-like DNA-binding protein